MQNALLPVKDDPDILLSLLEDTARRLQITIRYEPIFTASENSSSNGGLCSLRGKKFLIVNSDLSAGQKCSVLSASLRQLDLEGVFVPPLVRDMLE